MEWYRDLEDVRGGLRNRAELARQRQHAADLLITKYNGRSTYPSWETTKIETEVRNAGGIGHLKTARAKEGGLATAYEDAIRMIDLINPEAAEAFDKRAAIAATPPTAEQLRAVSGS